MKLLTVSVVSSPREMLKITFLIDILNILII